MKGLYFLKKYWRMSNMLRKHFLCFFRGKLFCVRKEMAFPFKPTLLTILSFEVPADFRVWTAVKNSGIAETPKS